jgi:CheY-like chemotaxis protein
MLGMRPILLVEVGRDSQLMAWEVLCELGEAGHVVRQPDVEQALAHLREKGADRPAVILLDGFEPNEDGLDLLRTLKGDESLKSIPLVVLAAAADVMTIDECYRIGVAGYIVKSDDRRELADAMRAVQEYWTLSELPSGR